jgi:hypothetical protein
MKKKINAKPGDIVKVPLPDGTHTYARILIDDTYAFYDAKTKEDIIDLGKIIQKPILFMAWVDVFGLREGWWTIIGNLPLEGKLKDFYPRYFNSSPTDITYLNFYEVYKDEIEEAIKKDWIGDGKTQMGGLHGRVHIESRIMDYYEGHRNAGNRAVILVFKKMFGLPLDNL